MIGIDSLTVEAICTLRDEAQDVDDHETVTTCFLALGYHYKVNWVRATADEIQRARIKLVNHLNSVSAMETA